MFDGIFGGSKGKPAPETEAHPGIDTGTTAAPAEIASEPAPDAPLAAAPGTDGTINNLADQDATAAAEGQVAANTEAAATPPEAAVSGAPMDSLSGGATNPAESTASLSTPAPEAPPAPMSEPAVPTPEASTDIPIATEPPVPTEATPGIGGVSVPGVVSPSDEPNTMEQSPVSPEGEREGLEELRKLSDALARWIETHEGAAGGETR